MPPRWIRPERLVAVVTPVARFPLTADEETSVRHLRKYLGGFDRYIIGPQRLPKEFSDFKLKKFPAHYFTGVYEYNRLLLTEEFYRAFAAYEYILIYQLDCLVFASNLDEWCRKGWDYVGAPWLKNMANPEEGFSAVGNGGFSLRRVRSALAVFHSRIPAGDLQIQAVQRTSRLKFVYERMNPSSPIRGFLRRTKALFQRQDYRNNIPRFAERLADKKYHEDYFWAFQARTYTDDFRIPAPLEALSFSFETAPRYCLAANSGRMPFGCHAWTKYDRSFWEPFLLAPSD